MKVAKLEREWKAKVGKNDRVAPLEDLEKLFSDVRPPGGFTATEAAIKYGINCRTMRDRLEKQAKLGKVKRHQSPASNRVYYILT